MSKSFDEGFVSKSFDEGLFFQLGSFAEGSSLSRVSLRAATSLDAISQHRVSYPAGAKDVPVRSATMAASKFSRLLIFLLNQILNQKMRNGSRR